MGSFPVSLQALMYAENVRLSKGCCRYMFKVKTNEYNTILKINNGITKHSIKDEQGRVVGCARVTKSGFRETLEVETAGLPPMKIERGRGRFARFYSIVENQNQEILKLIPTRACSITPNYEIFNLDGSKLGFVSIGCCCCRYRISFPKDLDLKCKMALISFPIMVMNAFSSDTTQRSYLLS